MDKSELKYFRERLLNEENQREMTLEKMKENNSAEQDKYSPAELSNYDNHPAEIASEVYQTEMNIALKVHEEHQLKDIHDAIYRIDNGTFGKCAFCGKEISAERLEVLPYTRLCIDCEESKTIHPANNPGNRPVEEKIWDAPFGRKYLNKREDDENEGLDYLNDLVKYGTSDTPQDMGGYHDYEDYYTNDVDNQGIVDDMDRISNEQYKRQLPD